MHVFVNADQLVTMVLTHNPPPHAQSALMVAARNGHLGCVKLLLGRGASLGLTTHRGGQQVTAIQLAKKAGHTEVLHYLQNCLSESQCIIVA